MVNHVVVSPAIAAVLVLSIAGIAATTRRSGTAGVIAIALPNVIVVLLVGERLPVPAHKSWNAEVPAQRQRIQKRQVTGECFQSPTTNVLALRISSE